MRFSGLKFGGVPVGAGLFRPTLAAKNAARMGHPASDTGGDLDYEVFRLGMVDDDGVGALLGVHVEALGETDAYVFLRL